MNRHRTSFGHLGGADEADRWYRRWLADGGKTGVCHPGPKPVQVYRVQSW